MTDRRPQLICYAEHMQVTLRLPHQACYADYLATEQTSELLR